MNVNVAIKTAQETIARQRRVIAWLRKHRKMLKDLPEGSVFGEQIDFDRLPHKDVIKVVRSLGGKWKKSENKTSSSPGPRIDYEQEIEGVRVRCWAGEAPPSCRIVEVEEVIPEKVIPAHTIKVRKMVCTGQDDPLVVAVAKQQ